MFRRFSFVALLACVAAGGAACNRGSNDAHYAELEKQRQEQAAQPAPSLPARPASRPPKPHETTGPTSAVRDATASMKRRLSPPSGRPLVCQCFGSSRSASDTLRLS